MSQDSDELYRYGCKHGDSAFLVGCLGSGGTAHLDDTHKQGMRWVDSERSRSHGDRQIPRMKAKTEASCF